MSRPVVSRCLLCGARHAACGPSGTTAPLDAYNAPRREPDMSELRLYRVVVGGNTTTMRLNESDAKRLGATLVVVKRAATVAPNVETRGGDVPNRMRAPVDKARRPETAG